MEKKLNYSIPLNIKLLGEVSSTNTLLKEQATLGAAEGEVIISESQTAGRGRRGRSFFSPEGSGLYLSLLLRPKFSAEEVAMLTTAAAAAAALAIEEVSGKATDIKWVNDIWLEGRKVCGILCEAGYTPEGSLDHVIVGMGVNVAAPPKGFPEELKDIAGAVFSAENAPNDARLAIAEAFLRHFTRFYANMGAREYFPEYRKRSFLLGQSINVLRGGESIPAEAVDINDECHLLVRYTDGSEEYLSSGEVSVRLR